MLEFDVSYARPFLLANWLSSLGWTGSPRPANCWRTARAWAGSLPAGWICPRSYDREEVHRVLQTARIIR